MLKVPWGIPTHHQYVARKACAELRRIQAPPGKKGSIIKVAARKAVEVTHKKDRKLASVMWDEMKLCYPDIITDADRPSCL